MHYTFAQTAKTWTSLFGTILTLVIPWALQISQTLPPPWPAVVAAIMAVLTALGVYKVPNAPARNTISNPVSDPVSNPTVISGYDFPWPKG